MNLLSKLKYLQLLFLIMIAAACQSKSPQKGTFEKAGKVIDDSVITSKIKVLYAADKLLNPFDISVSTKDGVVTLEGTLKTRTEYTHAISLAASVEGVKTINPKGLSVSDSDQPLEDAWITGRIRGKLLQVKLFGDDDVALWPVHIETQEGTVYISGEVDNEEQRENIIKIAEEIAGKNAVNASLLKVK